MSEVEPSVFDIETERLRLRPLGTGDEALFHDLYTDAETMRFIGTPLSAEQAAKRFRKTLVGMQQRPLKWLSLAILEKISLQPLGICGMPQFDASIIRQEVGILLKGEARSRGLAQEGLAALMQRIFAVLPTQEIYVRFSAQSAVTERLNIRMGFTPCADVSGGKGVMPTRIWSVHRSSWYAMETTD